MSKVKSCVRAYIDEFKRRHDPLSKPLHAEFNDAFERLRIDHIEFRDDNAWIWAGSNLVIVHLPPEFQYGFVLKSIARSSNGVFHVHLGKAARECPVDEIKHVIWQLIVEADTKFNEKRAEKRAAKQRLESARQSWKALEEITR